MHWSSGKRYCERDEILAQRVTFQQVLAKKTLKIRFEVFLFQFGAVAAKR